MLTKNYHTHTFRCNHATGTEREYIENAIRAGLRVMGFSDHSPYPFSGDYYSSFRMRPETLGEYVDTLTRLKHEYARDIEILIGLEAEYYPGRWQAFLDMIAPFSIDYLMLAQHFLFDEIGDRGVTLPCDDDARLIQYVDQVSAGLDTGKFSCLAHPDIFNYTGSALIYEREARRLCENAKRAGVPIEFNFLGVRTDRHYPRMDFWKVAGEVGNEVIYGLDAHNAESVYDACSYYSAQRVTHQYGLNHIETLALRRMGDTGAGGGI